MYKVMKIKNIFFKITVLLLIILISTFIITSVETEVSTEPYSDSIKLPIIMYHSILKSRHNKFIIHPEQLEADLVYIQEHNFNTITIKNLTDYVFNDIPLPEKPIMITFDDGLLNNYTYAVPLLEKYNMKAVFSVVGIYTEENDLLNERNPNYSYLNTIEMKEIIDSGIVEIQCHSYDLHKDNSARRGANKHKWESTESYFKVISDDIAKFKEAVPYEITAYTYPFGFYSESSEIAIKENGFLASLNCREKINYISKDNACLYGLGRFNRAENLTTEEFFRKVLKEY